MRKRWRNRTLWVLIGVCCFVYWLAGGASIGDQRKFLWSLMSFWYDSIEERDFYHWNASGLEPSNLRPKNVLILSSMGRSGSSFLGELIASQSGNVYFFEPERTLARGDREAVQKAVGESFRCRISEDFLERDFSWYAIRVSSPLMCHYERWVRSDVPKARRICERQGLRIVKTIRVRLEWMTELIEDEDLSLKVIHLVRDPRGSLLSQSTGHWPLDMEEKCQNVMQDLRHREKMEKDFPDRFLFIRYEDLCRDPWGKTVEIMRFLNTDATLEEPPANATRQADLPHCVASFLQSHNQFGFRFYSTYRNTLTVYQKWRERISQDFLKETEEQCGHVITALGYNLFGSVAAVRDMDIPITVDQRRGA
ncbi:carbohydrate sulfotransferase 1-like [Panulirus ornatus]|uniref:carbohydrate sulfotransferase 1-like n=1 Tax=Panulirus ornatus TaxID=150431 RepID=UPI003A861C38